MKKRIIALISIVLIVLFVSVFAVGCSYSSDASNGDIDKSNTENGEIDDLSESGESAPDRKIIYTAKIYITCDDVNDVADKIKDLINDDEWLEKSSVSDGYSTYTFRIKSDKIETFLSEVSAFGHVSSRELDSVDVSLSYYENVNRKTTLETEQAKLLVLLEEATDINDILQIDYRLSVIENELRQIEGNIKKYDSLIDYSQVTVTLREPYSVVENTFGSRLARSFRNGWNIAENLFIFLICLLPFAIVIGGIVVLIVFLVKRRKGIKSGKIAPKRKRSEGEIVPLTDELPAESESTDEPKEENAKQDDNESEV